ncbi:hypothetical protein FRC03_010734 [Tulasnella sp. 419]|nr:hypothetical protein FRC03_010734 [Tulasnella sp. 419]
MATASSSASIKSEKSDALFQVRLLAALRSGDPAELHPFLAEIGRKKDADADGELAAATLHLAIRCASYDTVTLLLAHRAISPNAVYPLDSKVSALHLAASLGRSDVVQLLLEQEDIDDSVRDADGRSVMDVAPKEVKEVIQESRVALAQTYITLLDNYISSPPTSPPPPALITLLNSPRAKSIDLSYLDEKNGTSLLHEAARRKDLRLVELAVRAGADIFVRDRRGKAVGEGSSKADDRVKVFLRQFTNQQTILDLNASEPPTLKGYLNKYTNVAKGYNTRWFVLKDGMLSYYRNQDDENLSCRGSISMKNAKLKTSATDRLRFEIASNPTRAGTSAQKWWMKANHPVEVARWTQAISRSIEFYHQNQEQNASGSGTPRERASSIRGTGYASDSTSMKASNSNIDGASIYAKSWKSPRKSTVRPMSISGRKGSPGRASIESKSSMGDETGGERDLQLGTSGVLVDKEDSDSIESSRLSGRSTEQAPPHQTELTLHANSTKTQIELTSQLVASLSSSSPSSNGSSVRQSELKTALQGSLDVLDKMFGEYLTMVKEREEWYERRVQRETEKSVMWENSLGVVVGETEGLERDLLRLREEKKKLRKAMRASMIEDNDKSVRNSMFKKPDRALPSAPDNEAQQGPSGQAPSEVPPPEPIKPPAVVVSSPPPESPTHAQPSTAIELPPHVVVNQAAAVIDAAKDEDSEDDDVDEFFDAIDQGIPNLVVTAPLVSPTVVKTEEECDALIDVKQYAGYAHPRERLPLANDNRPPVSLWAVLKGSIGKDLTKISFPVFFNEPTSMLQRMAEDMEFTECLDAAVAEQDSLKRIAYVAAFAMSNYSSTIGRIAKPFNPMLGETFEYCRIDRQYRYVSEQVSHHPPMSACWAESPTWHYYGEVDAKNKFMGKSFEIRPTGVAHAELLIPEEWVANSKRKYPKAPGKLGEGKVLEHYSWKKVTTNVFGFIVGSPSIDHYGDMIVTNHRTGERCILTFKPRGWTAKDAREIKGSVMDASGRVVWEIAGRWNSQLVARRAGSGNGDLLPDISISHPTSATNRPEYILLWRNTEKPSFPFNLTPFAVTLNDCPATLRPCLPPTDCRLRPDQRAFENGEYDKANELKLALEEFQRATRRRREAGEVPPHKPRWFMAETDRDTGERVWNPIRTESGDLEYWSERERVWKSSGKDHWKSVDKIFVDVPE